MTRILHQGKPVFEYNKITEYLYVGTNQCCTNHFNKTLIKKGIKADISLEEIRVDKPFGVKYYLWLPTKDHKSPSLEQLFCGASFIKNLADKKIKVYVHCMNGHGRAPILAAAYFILNGKSAESAISLIKKKRKKIHPNKHQIKRLTDFQKKFGRRD